jgi:CubicO group peptidase (beta-lactamase class C family)
MAEKYSGGGVTLMQLLMTDALGKAYPEIVQSLVLGPIGMTNSDLAKFAIEVQQTAVWRSTRVLTRASVLEMLTPVGSATTRSASRSPRRARGGTSRTAARIGASSAA